MPATSRYLPPILCPVCSSPVEYVIERRRQDSMLCDPPPRLACTQKYECGWDAVCDCIMWNDREGWTVRYHIGKDVTVLRFPANTTSTCSPPGEIVDSENHGRWRVGDANR